MRDDAKTEITVARIPRVPISGHAENSIREVIAFYEIVKDVSVDVEQVTKDWVATRARHLSKSDAAELRKLFGQMAETLTKVVKSMEPEGGKVDVASILSTFSI